MKKNLKLTITALSVLLVMAIATTVASFSKADEPTKVNPLAGAAGDELEQGTHSTNVDYIIMNANDTTGNVDSKYHIVEIYADKPSGFGDFTKIDSETKTDDFSKYVLEGNKSLENLLSMDPAMIDYQSFKASEVGEGDLVNPDDPGNKVLETISRADLIYVSNIGDKFSATNDIGEELYNLLHVYAVGDYKPLIIDSPNASTGGGSSSAGNSGTTNASTNATINNVVNDYFATQGVYYNTYEWDASKSAATFLRGTIKDTYYVGINSRDAQKKWFSIYEEPSEDLSDDQKNNPDYLVSYGKVAKVLVVSGDSQPGRMYSELFNATTDFVGDVYYNDGTETLPYIPDGVLLQLGNDTQFKNAYSSRYRYRPDYAEVVTMSIDDIATGNIDGYDLVILESSCSNVKVGSAAYDRMAAAMKSNMYIIYDKALATVAQQDASSGAGASDAGSGDVQTSEKVTNYQELYNMVATKDGLARTVNILPTSSSAMSMIMNSKSAAICKTIADLINNSAYRGIGGPAGAGSNSFNVLEIQPAYPIDVDFAKKQGKYYHQGFDMAPSGTTKEQLGIEDNYSDISGFQEYYAWELSKAKISDTFGVEYDSVNIDYVSVEELSAKKSDLLGTYDLIYIGGNVSALSDNAAQVMFSRPGGNIGNTSFDFVAWGGEHIKVGSNLLTEPFKQYTERDITSDDLKALEAYLNADLPVVISNDVVAAMKGEKSSIGKNTNMYKFIEEAEKNSTAHALASTPSGKGNVLYGFDVRDTVIERLSGLGTSARKDGGIEVFRSTDKDGDLDASSAKLLLQDLYIKNAKRLAVDFVQVPVKYNYYDKSTRLKEKTLKFKIESNIDNPTVKLYIDHDENAAFDDGSYTLKKDKNGYYTYNMADYEGGLVVWKLEVSSGGQVKSTTSQTCLIADTDKKQVNVLQIVPVDLNGTDIGIQHSVFGAQGTIALMFCTECQRATHMLKYNPVATTGYYGDYEALYMSSDGGSKFGNGSGADGGGWSDSTKGMVTSNIYMGKHEHKFGIVKYDGSDVYSYAAQNATGRNKNKGEGTAWDDWDWNFADELKDNYEFHLETITTREYEDIDLALNKKYAGKIGDADTIDQTQKALNDAKKALDTQTAVNGPLDQAQKQLETVIEKMAQSAESKGETVLAANFRRLNEEDCYYEFYSSFPKAGNQSDNFSAAKDTAYYQDAKGGFYYYYSQWVKEHDKKIDLEAAYVQAKREHSFVSNEGDWLTDTYSSVIIGPAEFFGGDDLWNKKTSKIETIVHSQWYTETRKSYIDNPNYTAKLAYDDLKNGDPALKHYADNDGQVILFHETLSRFADSGSSNITRSVMSAAGIKGYSDTQMSANNNYALYKYGFLKWNIATLWSQGQGMNDGTDHATINNRAAVNTYPFSLSDSLKIAGTHPVGYSIDTESRNVTPLYSLAACSPVETSQGNYGPDYQSIHAADPNDGTDNYFIYKSGNVYYCGAGHGKITGPGKNNNDERRLYINIVCSSVASSTVMPEDPEIEVFDPGTTEKDIDEGRGNALIKKTDDGYTYMVEEKQEPDFTFRAESAAGTTISSVSVYYKLDNSFESKTSEAEIKEAMAYNKETDKMIADSSSKIGSSTLLNVIADGGLATIDAENFPNLKLTDDMFKPYGGGYTYIVIEVKDNKGGTTYQKIRVSRKPHLFDLT